MNITIVSATQLEIQPILHQLKKSATPDDIPFRFSMQQHTIDVVVTGIGLTQMACNASIYAVNHQDNLFIHAGISGSFTDEFKIGDVVLVKSEQFGDFGLQESDGSFRDLFQTELMDGNQPPFQNGQLLNPKVDTFPFLPLVSGLTVNTVTGTNHRKQQLIEKYQPDVESMEGAAFFYVALQLNLNFLSLRSISNLIEPRNKTNWNIPLAVKNLNVDLWELLQLL